MRFNNCRRQPVVFEHVTAQRLPAQSNRKATFGRRRPLDGVVDRCPVDAACGQRTTPGEPPSTRIDHGQKVLVVFKRQIRHERRIKQTGRNFGGEMNLCTRSQRGQPTQGEHFPRAGGALPNRTSPPSDAFPRIVRAALFSVANTPSCARPSSFFDGSGFGLGSAQERLLNPTRNTDRCHHRRCRMTKS